MKGMGMICLSACDVVTTFKKKKKEMKRVLVQVLCPVWKCVWHLLKHMRIHNAKLNWECFRGFVALQLRPDTRFIHRMQLILVENLWLNTSKIILWLDHYHQKKTKTMTWNCSSQHLFHYNLLIRAGSVSEWGKVCVWWGEQSN